MKWVGLVVIYLCCTVQAQETTTKWVSYSYNTSTIPLDLYTTTCSIERRHNLSMEQFITEYQSTNIPVIIVRDKAESKKFQEACEKINLLDRYGTNEVILSTANTFSHNKVKSTLADYITTIMSEQDISIDGATSYLLFGDNNDKELSALFADYARPNYPIVQQGEFLSTEQAESSLSWGVAGSGTGVPFHVHGAVFNEVIHGLKRWFLYPPEVQPIFNADETTLFWLKNTYPTLINKHLLKECVLGPNEILYLPDFWWHATLNIGETVNIATFV